MLKTIDELILGLASPIKETSHFSLIGDIHGQMITYQKLCSCSNYSLQVGDLCINKEDLNKLVNPIYHKFFCW